MFGGARGDVDSELIVGMEMEAATEEVDMNGFELGKS